MKPVVVIEEPAAFQRLIEQLRQARHIAIDTESNSFYAYYERVCLIQISTPEDDFIIDPLALGDLSGLQDALADPAIEKVFHAAPNDILGLKRDFHFTFHNLFDTAVACKLLGYKQLGLARILQQHFAVTLNKKWQRCDWGRRPLSEDQLDYARLDTHHLLALRHLLAQDLVALDLWESVKEASERTGEQEVQQKIFHPEGFIQIRGARSLDPVGKSVLRALYLYRDYEAKRRNRAPFRVLSDETLVRLAAIRPKSLDDFVKIKGLPRPFHNSRSAGHLLSVIRKWENCAEEANAHS